jgi:hypothetical protein
VPAAGQFAQARGHLPEIGAELPRELAGLRRAPGLGERPVHRQPQILTVHAAIFAKPDEYPGRQESRLRERIYGRTPRSDQQEGNQPR